MSLDENVVMFPYSPGEPATLEAVRERVDAIRQVFIESSLEAIMGSVVDSLMAGGFELDDETMLPDLALLQESLRGLMLKTKGIPHPFQEMANDLFTINYDSGEVVFTPYEKDGTIE